MNSFTYLVPTKVIFGTDALTHLPAELANYAPKKVLVLYGSGSTVRTGVLGKVTDALDAAAVPYVAKGGVQPNPILSFVYSTLELCKAEGVDFILAVGGGSVLDTAKAVAHGIASPEVDVWDFYLGKATVTKTTPVASVLTIAAAGSETSDSSVITDEANQNKRGLSTEFNRPVFALLNPEFTHTLPKFQVACGVVDILMHTMDRYFAADCDNEITDQIAEGLMRTVMMFGQTAYADPTDAKAMSELMWCGSLSHNGITGLGNNRDFCPHQLGHGLSGIYNAAHGATLAVTWGAFANYVSKAHPERFARYGRNVLNIQGTDDAAVAQQAIDTTKAYFASLDMPLTLTQLLGHTPTDEEIETLVTTCSFGGTRTIGSLQPMDEADMRAVYQSVR